MGLAQVGCAALAGYIKAVCWLGKDERSRCILYIACVHSCMCFIHVFHSCVSFMLFIHVFILVFILACVSFMCFIHVFHACVHVFHACVSCMRPCVSCMCFIHVFILATWACYRHIFLFLNLIMCLFCLVIVCDISCRIVCVSYTCPLTHCHCEFVCALYVYGLWMSVIMHECLTQWFRKRPHPSKPGFSSSTCHRLP